MNVSYSNYENIIAEFYNCNVTVRTEKPLKGIFQVVPASYLLSITTKNKTVIVLNENLPAGIFAHRMIVNHRIHHIVEIPIYNINNSNLFSSMYREHHFGKDITNIGVSKSILNILENFDISLPYLQKHLIGLTEDGQYIQLGVENYMKKNYM